MSLSAALDLSRSSLATISELTEIASRNIANVSNSGASRKVGNLVTEVGGGARVSWITRAAMDAFRDGVMGATADAARYGVLSTALDRLDSTGGDSLSGGTPALLLGSLRSALQTLSADPANESAAGGVLSAAYDLVEGLHDWSRNIADVRARADADIRDSVSHINSLLMQYGELDAKIVNGTISSSDVTDQLDARDEIIGNIAQEIGLTVVARANNSIALYTDSGIALFEGVARTVAVQPAPLVDGLPGGVVFIDGLPAVGIASPMPVGSGRLVGLVEVRDKLAIAYSAQIDDIAGGIIRAFAEVDQGVPTTLPGLAGLFVNGANADVPAAGSSIPGLARSIEVNANADPARGGDLARIRDGGISNPSNPRYVYNEMGATGFNLRVQQLVELLSRKEVHDPASELRLSASVLDYASASIGWIEGKRQTTSQDSIFAEARLQRTQDALSKRSGINIDDEMAQLLGLERTYQASAKLITTVDSMFAALLQAIG